MEIKDYAVAILINEENEILLQKKTRDYTEFPNYWAFFGGGIKQGETPQQALKREIKEELGYKVNKMRLFKAINYKTNIKQGKGYYFIIEFEGKLRDLKLNEGVGFAFFSEEEISNLKLNPMDTKILKEFFKNEI